MKFTESLKKFFTHNVPLKLLAVVLAVICTVVINAFV